MEALRWLILTLLSIYFWIVIAQVILSWLVAFNVVNLHNPVVNTIGRFLHQATEPVMRPIRNILPALGGIDLSPMVVLLGIYFLRILIITNWPATVGM